SIGAGSANESTSAMVALGSSRRAPVTWISTPRMSGLASVFMLASSLVPAVGDAPGELHGRAGVRAARDHRAGGRVVEAFLGRLPGHQGPGDRQFHDLVLLRRVGAAEQQQRAVVGGPSL